MPIDIEQAKALRDKFRDGAKRYPNLRFAFFEHNAPLAPSPKQFEFCIRKITQKYTSRVLWEESDFLIRNKVWEGKRVHIKAVLFGRTNEKSRDSVKLFKDYALEASTSLLNYDSDQGPPVIPWMRSIQNGCRKKTLSLASFSWIFGTELPKDRFPEGNSTQLNYAEIPFFEGHNEAVVSGWELKTPVFKASARATEVYLVSSRPSREDESTKAVAPEPTTITLREFAKFVPVDKDRVADLLNSLDDAPKPINPDARSGQAYRYRRYEMQALALRQWEIDIDAPQEK